MWSQGISGDAEAVLYYRELLSGTKVRAKALTFIPERNSLRHRQKRPQRLGLEAIEKEKKERIYIDHEARNHRITECRKKHFI